MSDEYAKAGVDYSKIDPFKHEMREMGQRTLAFPEKRRNVRVSWDGSFAYLDRVVRHHSWRKVSEGLGNKNWIAEWMYQETSDPRYFLGIGIDTAMMAVVDLLRWGALPVVYTSEVSAGDSEWFEDAARRHNIVESFFHACELAGMALVGGETASLRYLVRSEPPVKSAPVFSGSAVGLIVPFKDEVFAREITGEDITSGTHILGVTSSGLHANGISLVIKRAMTLPDQFLHVLPNGKTLGEEALIPTRSYMRLMESLLAAGVKLLAVVPATGGGIAKLAAQPWEFTYRIRRWVEVPTIFQFMPEFGVPLKECLETFNWGIGLWLLAPEEECDRIFKLGRQAGYELHYLGVVEKGSRKVIFQPERVELLPPAS